MQFGNEWPLDNLSRRQPLHKGPYVLWRHGSMPRTTPGCPRLEGHWQIFPAKWMLWRNWPASSKEGAEKDAGSSQKVTLLARRTTVPIARVLRKKWSRLTCCHVEINISFSVFGQKYIFPPDDMNAGRKRCVSSIAGAGGTPTADCDRGSLWCSLPWTK